MNIIYQIWLYISIMALILMFQYFIGLRLSINKVWSENIRYISLWILRFDIQDRKWYRYKKIFTINFK